MHSYNPLTGEALTDLRIRCFKSVVIRDDFLNGVQLGARCHTNLVIRDRVPAQERFTLLLPVTLKQKVAQRHCFSH